MSSIDKYVHMFYISLRKLSQYARQQGISYRTALRWWRAGQIKGYQAPTGTIVVVEAEPVLKSQKVALYARVSSAEHRTNLERQAERLLYYCEAPGYQVSQVGKRDSIRRER
jgi:putative resolvase